MSKDPLLFLIAFCVALILHLLIVLMIYHPGTMISMPVTAGMIFSWLYTSRVIKDLNHEKKVTWQNIKIVLPFWLKYALYFFIIYAFINFVIALSLESGHGWVELQLDHDKLRGISGFWVLFYATGFSAAWIKNKISL